jgi:hypothetical protein
VNIDLSKGSGFHRRPTLAKRAYDRAYAVATYRPYPAVTFIPLVFAAVGGFLVGWGVAIVQAVN